MKSLAIFGAFLALLLAQSVCCCGTGGGNHNENANSGGSNTNGANNNSQVEPAAQSIGQITSQHDRVLAGPTNSLEEFSGTRDLYKNNGVKVTDGGRAYLEFRNQIALTLYNDSDLGGVDAELDPNTPNFVRVKLFRGGLSGHVVDEGDTAQISVGNNTTIKVLGTHFFVVFDEQSGFTTIGNFDGRIEFSPNGMGFQPLPPQTMVDISPGGEINFLELLYGVDTFDKFAENYGSPVEGLRASRMEFAQPLPGETPATEPPFKPVTTVFRSLVMRQGDNYIPDLAESWSVDPDGYVIVFHLRPGLYRPDGNPFTGSDVRDQLEARWQYAMDGRVSFELIDDLTISFHLFEPAVGYVLNEMSNFTFEVRLG